jgi:hypothetical protein
MSAFTVPKALIFVKGRTWAEVYADPAFSEAMAAMLERYSQYLPPQ